LTRTDDLPRNGACVYFPPTFTPLDGHAQEVATMAARTSRSNRTRRQSHNNGIPTPGDSLRARKYRRRSTNEENQPYSIEAQDAGLDPYIQSQPGWVADGEYEDDASGATMERDGLQRALRDAKAGLYDVLLVYRLDRLTRSIRDLLIIVDILDEAGVALVSATEHFDTQTPIGRMVMRILAIFAEFERDMIIDRVIGGMERKAARGGWTAGSHPFGYSPETRPDGTRTGFLVPNQHASLVAIIFELYGRRNLGAHAIAHWLNQQGHRTRNHKPWNHKAVLQLLRNRAYIGEVWFRDTWHKAPHRPLIKPELFDTVQDLLAERGDDHPGQVANRSDYDLAGLIYCSRCGKRYIGNAAHGRNGRYRYYTCYSRQRYGTATCPADRLPADQLEHAIRDALLATYQRGDLFHQAVVQAHRHAAAHQQRHTAELATIQAKLHQTDQAIDRYLDAFEHRTMPDDLCRPRLEKLSAQRDQLRVREQQLRDLLATNTTAAPDPAALTALRRRIQDIFARGNGPTRKALLKTLIAEIKVDNRHTIRPFFYVPTLTSNNKPQVAVRDPGPQVEVGGLEPPSHDVVPGLLRAQPPG